MKRSRVTPTVWMAGVFAMVLVIGVPSLSATTVTVTDVVGTAQYRVGSGEWQPLQVDARLPGNAEVVTSLRASVTVDAAGNTIVVDGLTRVRVSELSRTDGVTRTRLDLPYGRLSADVRTTANRGNDFSVASPIATAAVRGTEFTFSGYELDVSHGDVELANRIGQTHSVRAGQVSRAYGVEGIQSVEQTLQEQTLLRD